MLPTVGFAFHLSTIYLVKVFFGFKGPDHLQLVNKILGKVFCGLFRLPGSTRLSSIKVWLNSARSTFQQSLARLNSARGTSGSTQLNSRNCQLEPSLVYNFNITLELPPKKFTILVEAIKTQTL